MEGAVMAAGATQQVDMRCVAGGMAAAKPHLQLCGGIIDMLIRAGVELHPVIVQPGQTIGW